MLKIQITALFPIIMIKVISQNPTFFNTIMKHFFNKHFFVYCKPNFEGRRLRRPLFVLPFLLRSGARLADLFQDPPLFVALHRAILVSPMSTPI